MYDGDLVALAGLRRRLSDNSTFVDGSISDGLSNSLLIFGRQTLKTVVDVLDGSFSDQAGHFGSSWPGGGERPPIRYEDSWGDLGGALDTQLLIYSYKKR